jgi:hypothetical protein
MRGSRYALGRATAFVAVLLVGWVVLFPAGAVAVADSGDNTTAPFRIVASGDADPEHTNRTTTQFRPSNGSWGRTTVTRPPASWSLDRGAYTAARSRAVATQVDAARSNLYRPVFVPVGTDWIPLSSPRVQGTKIVPQNRTTYSVYANVSPMGAWLPVRDATVDENGTRVTNPGRATVNAGRLVRLRDRQLRAIRAVPRANLTGDTATGITAQHNPVVRSRAANGTRRGINGTATGPGTRIAYHWASASERVLLDHWAWVPAVSPGAWSPQQGAFVVSNRGVNVTALADVNATTTLPSYEEETTCRDEDGSHTVRRYERFSFRGYDVHNRVTIGTATNVDRPADDTPFGVVRLDDPNGTQLRLQSTAEVHFEHTYGETDPCDGSWSRTDFVTASHTTNRTYPVITTGVERLDVDVYVVNRSPGTELYVHSDGGFDIAAYPLHRLTVTASGRDGQQRRFALLSPWRFYRLRAYDCLQRPSGHCRSPSLAHSTSLPTLWRDYISPEAYRIQNNSLGLVIDRRQTGAHRPSWQRGPNRTVAAAHPMATARVERVTNRATPVTFYDRLGGTLTRLPATKSDTVTVTLTDIFGGERTIDPTYRNYTCPSLRFRVRGEEVAIRLAHEGRGLADRSLALTGAATPRATTNATGWATVTPTAGVVRVQFSGTPYNASHSRYYEAVEGSRPVPAVAHDRPISVWGRLATATDHLLAIAEWLLLGLLARLLYRRQ